MCTLTPLHFTRVLKERLKVMHVGKKDAQDRVALNADPYLLCYKLRKTKKNCLFFYPFFKRTKKQCNLRDPQQIKKAIFSTSTSTLNLIKRTTYV